MSDAVSKKCYSFNLETCEWSTEPSLNKGRTVHSSVTLGKQVFVVGGFDGIADFITSMEVMDMGVVR